MLRTVAREGEGPATKLARLNNLLAAENEQSMFVTVSYAEAAMALTRVFSDLSAFTAGAMQSDDITAVVVHWKG